MVKALRSEVSIKNFSLNIWWAAKPVKLSKDDRLILSDSKLLDNVGVLVLGSCWTLIGFTNTGVVNNFDKANEKRKVAQLYKL